MFFISLPHTIKIGDTVACRINRESAMVTWKDNDTMVIPATSARSSTAKSGATCAHSCVVMPACPSPKAMSKCCPMEWQCIKTIVRHKFAR